MRCGACLRTDLARNFHPVPTAVPTAVPAGPAAAPTSPVVKAIVTFVCKETSDATAPTFRIDQNALQRRPAPFCAIAVNTCVPIRRSGSRIVTGTSMVASNTSPPSGHSLCVLRRT